jgi:hypothetical protein
MPGKARNARTGVKVRYINTLRAQKPHCFGIRKTASYILSGLCVENIASNLRIE